MKNIENNIYRVEFSGIDKSFGSNTVLSDVNFGIKPGEIHALVGENGAGKGTAINTLMGVLILGLIGNILNLLNVPSYPQQVIKGLIIIFAVLLQRFEDKYQS